MITDYRFISAQILILHPRDDLSTVCISKSLISKTITVAMMPDSEIIKKHILKSKESLKRLHKTWFHLSIYLVTLLLSHTQVSNDDKTFGLFFKVFSSTCRQIQRSLLTF